ncbi:uncharacterized protein LOC130630223 [Hydractinia symbiolongicarpus]|uniref:uncharacterized protein LOC130630223 n=1 Tax=Hydractinia symbiolongicarpus TaxID=13093 RepID=UPI0025514E9F|nr:uncharacterized protein LOC130630223 [Hydractinia symbiolongicarpus]
MSKNEISLVVLADFLKAFDTVQYETTMRKLNQIGFSKEFVELILSYLCGRKQIVRINDKTSEFCNVTSGVPQGSILGPVIFNLYVTDLEMNLTMSTLQYADDTTLFTSTKLNNLAKAKEQINGDISQLQRWSTNNNLVLNKEKTKLMVFSTSQMSKRHNLNDLDCTDIKLDDFQIERVPTWSVLGVKLDEHLSWNDHVQSVVSCCHGILSILRKLKRMAPFKLRKQLAEMLVLSKLDFNDTVYIPLTAIQIRKLHKVMICAASFVWNKYSHTEDITRLGWLPIKQRREWHLMITAFKSVHQNNWPKYLKNEIVVHKRTLRNADEIRLKTSLRKNTFEDNTPTDLLNFVDENEQLSITRSGISENNLHSTPNVKCKQKSCVFVPMDEGFEQMKILFQNHFDMEILQYNLFQKNIKRFINTNKKWSRNNARNKNQYYSFFSPTN